ncbi:MAG: leucyl/phenylalanyl-tRNA--protein transferase [Bacteroidota bacterium]
MHGGTKPPSVLDPEFLLNAYRQGFFPMADSDSGEINWFSPDPRGILELDELVISRSLRRTIRQGAFEVRLNTVFEAVLSFCRARPETWISEAIVRSYLNLHRLGHAHSVEAWRDGRLAGGLYGVSIGGAFFGESMFSLERDASKCALVFLVERLRERKFTLLDTQFLTPHLATLGATEIPRSQYLRRLSAAMTVSTQFV